MAKYDLDIEAAMRNRMQGPMHCAHSPIAEDQMGVVRGLIERISKNRLYVWEPNAIAAMEDFWSDKRNEKRFRDLCFVGSQPRFLRTFLDPAYHYCAADGFLLPSQTVPAEDIRPWAHDVFAPSTRAIGYVTAFAEGAHVLVALLGTTHFHGQMVRPDNWRLVEPQLTRLPKRDLFESQFVKMTMVYRVATARDGLFEYKLPLDWVELIYKMRLFLEQPFVGQSRHRPQKSERKNFKSVEAYEIVKVNMREGLTVSKPKLILPGISRFTGRPLEFEVEVDSHLRRCASGKIIRVCAHTRGPKGVRREKVIKVVR